MTKVIIKSLLLGFIIGTVFLGIAPLGFVALDIRIHPEWTNLHGSLFEHLSNTKTCGTQKSKIFDDYVRMSSIPCNHRNAY